MLILFTIPYLRGFTMIQKMRGTLDIMPEDSKVFDYIENNSFDPNDVEACADIMKKAALIAGLTTGDVAVILIMYIYITIFVEASSIW